jgi:hypothetical protein
VALGLVALGQVNFGITETGITGVHSAVFKIKDTMHSFQIWSEFFFEKSYWIFKGGNPAWK